jgi:porphobilinogen synthase
MRRNEILRRMVRETRLSVDNLIMPLFVRPGEKVKKEISSMPGNCQMSGDILVEEVKEIADLGIPAVLLFGIPEKKDDIGSEAWDDDGVVQKTVRAIRKANIGICVITDVCLCEYTDHGHCGKLREHPRTRELEVDNDATLELLRRMAVSHARAGADIVAPSDMMDGRVAEIRAGLDDGRFESVAIMSYAAKFASGFYGPFREAAESPPKFGDRRGYQMDSPNVDEALREVGMDIEEGADIVMVKPALAYMDIIRLVKDRFGYPTAAYNVSGEFAMVKAAAQKGWLDEKTIVMEILTGIHRAGADLILTYWAKDVAGWLRGK